MNKPDNPLKSAMVYFVFMCLPIHADHFYRLLVIYTQAAADYSSDYLSTIELVVEETNTAYENSGINVRAELAGAFLTDYVGNEDNVLSLLRLEGTGDGYMEEGPDLRTRYSADVVMLMDNGDPPGWTNGTWAEFGSAFFVVLGYPGIVTGLYTPAHEIGHLFGGLHDDDPSDYPFAYGHGYVTTTFKTIMYHVTESINQFFPNPNQTYFSVAMGTTGWNDMTRVHNEYDGAITTFHETPGTLSLPSTTIRNNEYADAIAVSSIDVSGPYHLNNGSKAQFRANGSISIQPGFESHSHSVKFKIGGQDLAKKGINGNVKESVLSTSHLNADLRAIVKKKELLLNYTIPEGGKILLDVFALNGEKVFQWQWDESSGSHYKLLELHDTPKQLLFIRMSSPKSTVVRKIVMGG